MVRLRRCDLTVCEALCCHDGAYLEADDEVRIAAAMLAYPDAFADLPTELIVEEDWRGLGAGRKTATRPWQYRRTIPAHFPATRCVFADEHGWCRLESVARHHDLHPWIFKPRTCYLFPLMDDDPAAGPAPPGCDPYDRGDDYPGFATIVDCGRHCADGQPWRRVLREERSAMTTPIDVYFAALRQQDANPARRHVSRGKAFPLAMPGCDRLKTGANEATP